MSKIKIRDLSGALERCELADYRGGFVPRGNSRNRRDGYDARYDSRPRFVPAINSWVYPSTRVKVVSTTEVTPRPRPWTVHQAVWVTPRR